MHKHTTNYSNENCCKLNAMKLASIAETQRSLCKILLISRYVKQSQDLKHRFNRSNARRFRINRSRELIFRVIYSARSTTIGKRDGSVIYGSQNRPIFRR